MLTEEQMTELTMFMRVVNFLGNNLEKIRGNKEMMDVFTAIKAKVADIFSLLSDEDHDILLERFKEEMELLGLSKPD